MNFIRCCGDTWPAGAFRTYKCSSNATVERDGRHYCKRHDPVRVAERDKKRRDEFDRRMAAERAIREREAQRLRRGDLVPELLEALKAVRRFYENAKHLSGDEDAILEQVRAAIAKAEGA